MRSLTREAAARAATACHRMTLATALIRRSGAAMRPSFVDCLGAPARRGLSTRVYTLGSGADGHGRAKSVRNYFYAFSVAVSGLAICIVPLYRLFCSTTGAGSFSGADAHAERLNADLNSLLRSLLQSASEFYRFLPVMLRDGKNAALDAAVARREALLVHRGGLQAALSARAPDPTHVVPLVDEKTVLVSFSGAPQPGLPWDFVPLTPSVTVVPGETALAFFRATNKGPFEVTGVSTYSINPPEAMQYFQKIQCFCFEEQRLLPGESVDMPVFFYLDPEFANDPETYRTRGITLSYIFFASEES